MFEFIMKIIRFCLMFCVPGIVLSELIVLTKRQYKLKEVKMGIKETWNTSPKKKRAELARALGYKSEWAKIRFEELPTRSGGMLQRDLVKLWKLRKSKKR